MNNSDFDIVIRTKNSGKTLDSCISSVLSILPQNRIFIIDGGSTDDTIQICNRYGITVYYENKGLSYATSLAAKLSNKKYILFVDSDVTIKKNDFHTEAIKILQAANVGSVVGNSIGYPFNYGLPLGLTMIRRSIIETIKFPENIKGRETYYIQKYLRINKLKVRYIENA
ncbi:MAG: glycosyltransferase family 2 protein, partial [Thermoplasmataceae archaeon]